jgi:hypothetical protein
MKLSPAKSTKPKDIRQAQMQSDFAAAGPMRDRFPQLGELHVDLAFASRIDPSPSAQSFTLYPAARAFFKYRCPCTDCDGMTDLGAAVKELAASAIQTPGRSSGQLVCPGTRLANSAFSQSCSMLVKYQLRAVPRRDVITR